MKKIGCALSLLFTLCVATLAHAQLTLTGAGCAGVCSGGGVDPATTAWVNAVVADGGGVSSTQQARVDTLIKALKSAGAFSTMKRLWLYAGESDAHQAKIDIINLATNTNHSMTLSAGGYTGNGTSQYLDTGYNPITDGLSPSTSIFGAYVLTNDAASNPAIMGGLDGSHYVLLQLNTGSSIIYGENGSADFNSWSASSSIGAWTLFSSDSTHMTLYKNGSSLARDQTLSLATTYL